MLSSHLKIISKKRSLYIVNTFAYMLPDFPQAKQIIAKSQEDFFNACLKEKLGSLFGNIPKRILVEGNRMKQQYTSEVSHETHIKKIQASFKLSISEIKKRPDAIYEMLVDVASDFAKQQTLLTLESINQVTSLTGNVINNSGEFTIEHFFKSIEMVEIDFDEIGQPIFPTITGSPEAIERIKDTLKKSEFDPQNEIRMKILIEQKRKEWNDRKNNRKLVD